MTVIKQCSAQLTAGGLKLEQISHCRLVGCNFKLPIWCFLPLLKQGIQVLDKWQPQLPYTLEMDIAQAYCSESPAYTVKAQAGFA